MVRNLILSFATIAALLAIAGFFGQTLRELDSLALLRPVFGGLCILGIFAARPALLSMFFGAVAFVSLATVIPFFLPQPSGQDLRIYSKNIWFANNKTLALVADIQSANVDAVFLQELTTTNKIVLDQLKGDFPHQHFCAFPGLFGSAVLSRRPFVDEPVCSQQRAIAAAPVLINETRVWLVSAHIPWHWPVDSTGSETAAVDTLVQLSGPMVIAGDFNSFPWTARVDEITTLTNTQVAGPVRPTLYYRSIPLPIDLAMAPGGGSVERRPKLGSDHAGIVADLALEPR